MSNYQRLEINLLPPELAPGPAVRLGTIVGVLLVSAAALITAISAISSVSQLRALQSDNEKSKQQIISSKAAEDHYNALMEIKNNTEGRGKLVGMASASYVEFPVILDRVSRLLPDGVHLIKTSSSGSGPGRGGSNKEIMLSLRTSSNDPALMSRTLEAFKASNLFRDVYLRTGDMRPEPIEELRNEFGIPWRAEGGGQDEGVFESYDFEIRASVNSPLEIDDLGTLMDKSELFQEFELKTDPGEKPGSSSAGGQAEAAGTTPASAPAPAAGGAAPAAGGAS